ncbi:hypothetical protein CAPTEDRAFT_221845 [Capitella teleta]|uniref:Mediator of RNA polymerase II transcription subunit 22 n=1 Tax=Capitella teleta TaxID=283909 RepID=R7VCH4_CAPTE|nr:hypothetical protein CAPTEDRAFT_221845 [Capitella teleta]|eukprot:ELU16242.1 hypothetical protein CAPTEDRAFT_221845 [Capitella teleta]
MSQNTVAQRGNQGSSTQTKEAQLKVYQKRLRDDIKTMTDNFLEIIRLMKIEEESHVSRPSKCEQDQFELEVRAANIVRAGESLMKLVSEVKQFVILNDFRSVNESIMAQMHMYRHVQTECDTKLFALRDDMAADLFEMEEEYYSSVYK